MGFKSYYSAGDFYALAQATTEHSSTDLSGKTAFGWTGVPIIIAGPHGEIEYEAEFIPERGDYPEHIQLVPKLKEIEALTY